MDINNILLDLEVIRQINENDKLSVNVLPGSVILLVDNSQYFTYFRRWYNGYNREDSIKYLESLVKNIEENSELIINGSHSELANSLKNSIKASLKGLENLKNTYINDSISVARLVLITNKLKKVILKLDDQDICNEISNVSINTIHNIENNNVLFPLGYTSNNNTIKDINNNTIKDINNNSIKDINNNSIKDINNNSIKLSDSVSSYLN